MDVDSQALENPTDRRAGNLLKFSAHEIHEKHERKRKVKFSFFVCFVGKILLPKTAFKLLFAPRRQSKRRTGN